jgi:hypothetical protein
MPPFPLSLLAPATDQEAKFTEINHATGETETVRRRTARQWYRMNDKTAVA